MSRNTRQKEAILRALRKTTDHPGAGWLHVQVRRALPNISLGTVYRNLRSLREEGAISELQTGSGSRFDALPGNHYHFHCQRCSAVINLDAASNAELDKTVSEKYHLAVAFHRLDFYGLCPACEKATTPPVNKKRGENDG